MYLADTSVWIDFLRYGDETLSRLLTEGKIHIHPFIIGEIALGSLSNRSSLLQLLEGLPPVNSASHDEVMTMIEARSVHSRGIGYVDVHLLAASLITPPVLLWTRDKRLAKVASDLNIGVDLLG